MDRSSAEVFSLQALAWLVNSEELFPTFLGSSGLTADELKSRASEATILGAVLDFIMLDDAWVLDGAQSMGVDPQDFMRARQSLPGGQDVAWT